jgi:NADH-quinone oxidoreductase subunit E
MTTTAAAKPVDEAVTRVLERYPRDPSSLISVLEDLQEDAHYLPREALDDVARALGVSLSRCYHVATFYKAFSLTPQGEHVICVCRGTACHVRGADKLMDVLQGELGLADGQTSADGRFTLHSVRCLGCCSLAPVAMIDGKIHGYLTGTSLRKLLKRYRDVKA